MQLEDCEHFEDLELDIEAKLPNVQLNADAIKEFARSYDPFPFHLDEEVASRSMLGGLAASGWQTTIIAQSLVTANACPGLRVRQSLRARNVRWLQPTRVDQVLAGSVRVDALDPQSAVPGCGCASFQVVLLDETGNRVMQAIFDLAVLRRTAATGDAA